MNYAGSGLSNIQNFKAPMHVIVATGLNDGAAEYKNLGDVAMLQAAVGRLLWLWPDARIDVLTDSPSNLARFCPGALPLPREGCACWQRNHVLLGGYHQRIPAWLSVRLSALKWAIGTRWPSLVDRLTLLKLENRDPQELLPSLKAFLKARNGCDLFVVCGSGGFADSCQSWNLFILGTLAGALSRGKKVAMLGQGMGPLSNSQTLSWARRVFPRVNLIALRGTEGGQQLLQRLGVHPAVVVTTGDDAIELASQVPVNALRTAIGVNLRVAPYSGVDANAFAVVGSVLRQCVRKFEAKVLPIPIAFHDYANDVESSRQLLTGVDNAECLGVIPDSPLKLMERTARCRIVVTGAYHAAVFALAQGIPAVCLSNSDYYSAKFAGLKKSYPRGCWSLSLGHSDLKERLSVAIDEAWESADSVREYLVNSTADQLEAGRNAYRRLKDLTISKVKTE